jgi:hypothetical protein
MINANRFAIVCFAASFFGILLGCASSYKPPPPVYKNVQIISDPAGARIVIDGNYIGDAPLVTKLRIDPNNPQDCWSSTVIQAIPKGDGYVQTERGNCADRIFFDTNLHYTRPQIPIQIQ